MAEVEEDRREEKGLHASKSERLGLVVLLSRDWNAAIVD